MDKDTVLYFHNISYNGYQDQFLDSLSSLSEGSKFFITMSRRFKPSRFISRNGEWSLPWPQELIPKFSMPDYDLSFKKTFEEVTDNEALLLRNRVRNGDKFALMWSGGLDSTVVLCSILKNFSEEDLKSFSVCASLHSVIENPIFYKKYIHNKINVIDSNQIKYDNLFLDNLIPITADEGDPIFGTMIGIGLYQNYNAMLEGLSPTTQHNLKNIKSKMLTGDLHYSNFKDLIIKQLTYKNDFKFGQTLYEKYVRNIETASVPVHSVHDFFWWLIFNVKYLNCSVRAALYFNDSIDYKKTVNETINWYNSKNYQLWSMVNNNNGQKILGSVSTYKHASRQYIYNFDKNIWYKNFKIKLESLNLVVNRQDTSNSNFIKPAARIAFDKNYKPYSIDDPLVKHYFEYHLEKYRIDWQ